MQLSVALSAIRLGVLDVAVAPDIVKDVLSPQPVVSSQKVARLLYQGYSGRLLRRNNQDQQIAQCRKPMVTTLQESSPPDTS